MNTHPKDTRQLKKTWGTATKTNSRRNWEECNRVETGKLFSKHTSIPREIRDDIAAMEKKQDTILNRTLIKQERALEI